MIRQLSTLLAALFLFGLPAAETADGSGLAWFDPGRPGSGIVPAPGGAVTVKVDRNRKTFRIPGRFYGINIHPLPARDAFRNPGLLRELRPDSIRIMVTPRTGWIKKDGRTVTTRDPMFPERGRVDWKELDALLSGIEAAGAEPYVTLGFGAPEWLNSGKGPKFGRPLPEDLPEYAKLKGEIAAHIARKFRVPYLALENEPENVKYPIDDYLQLCRLAMPEVRRAAPGVKIAGPATGYAKWAQPGGGALTFSKSLEKLRDGKAGFDVIDWHIYSGTPGSVFRTVESVRRVYGDRIPLFISELNLDWRYSGSGGAESRISNTGWNSAVWLAEVFDGLQSLGVERAYYFCLRNNFFGLYDYWITEVHPGFHVFRMFTSQLGRQRLEARSGHAAVGAVATLDARNRMAVLLYNRSEAPVTVRLDAPGFQPAERFTFSREWYETHRKITGGRAELLPPETSGDLGRLLIPARGILLLAETQSIRKQ